MRTAERPRRTRAANDETSATPREKLRTFIAEHVRPGADIDHSMILIGEALKRFDGFLLQGKDISKKAKQIADAAMKFANALESACAITEIDVDALLPRPLAAGSIMREGPESVWPYLRIANLMGSDGFGDDAASARRFGKFARSARRFDGEAGNAPALLLQARAIERQVLVASVAFSPPHRLPYIKSAVLRYELKNIWKGLSGKKSGHSGEGTFDNPLSVFGTFAKLAVNTTDWDSRKRANVFRTLTGRKVSQK